MAKRKKTENKAFVGDDTTTEAMVAANPEDEMTTDVLQTVQNEDLTRHDEQSDYVIEMRHITKEFPGIIANDDITLQLKRGEIHALLGENGGRLVKNENFVVAI